MEKARAKSRRLAKLSAVTNVRSDSEDNTPANTISKARNTKTTRQVSKQLPATQSLPSNHGGKRKRSLPQRYREKDASSDTERFRDTTKRKSHSKKSKSLKTSGNEKRVSRKYRVEPSGHSSSSDSETSSDSDSSDNSDSDDSVFDIITQHSNNLTAGNGGFGTSYNAPVSTPISSQLPKKLKKQIRSNKFVNFADLLPFDPSSSSQQKQTFNLQIERSQLSLAPSVRQRKITTIEAWTSAFLRFVAVYAKKFPDEVPALMKYGEIVRDLASRRQGQAWQTYDSHFRQLRCHTPLPWDSLHIEFWLRACTEPSSSPPNPHMTVNRSFRVPHFSSPKRFATTSPYTKFWPNTCWIYNRRGDCRVHSCKHPHICGFCKQPHHSGQCMYSSKEQAAQGLLGQSDGRSQSHTGPTRPQTGPVRPANKPPAGK